MTVLLVLLGLMEIHLHAVILQGNIPHTHRSKLSRSSLSPPSPFLTSLQDATRDHCRVVAVTVEAPRDMLHNEALEKFTTRDPPSHIAEDDDSQDGAGGRVGIGRCIPAQ